MPILRRADELDFRDGEVALPRPRSTAAWPVIGPKDDGAWTLQHSRFVVEVPDSDPYLGRLGRRRAAPSSWLQLNSDQRLVFSVSSVGPICAAAPKMPVTCLGRASAPSHPLGHPCSFKPGRLPDP